MEYTLAVKGLDVYVRAGAGDYPVLSQVDLTVGKGEIVGLVGESGCGKSMTALAAMGLLPPTAHITGGSISYRGAELTQLPERAWCAYRGKELSMIFQEPGTALNPLLPVGKQIAEAYLTHHPDSSKALAHKEALGMMRSVGLSRVESLYNEYPHRLSGGMKQRIVIAMALVNRPGLLIADEPTTALDVTIQYQILELIQEMNARLFTSVLLVSHDFGVIRHICSRVVVMYAGYVVEEGPAGQVLRAPEHPYTRSLLAAIPAAKKRGLPLYSIPGAVPPIQARPQACCPFCERCARAFALCRESVPGLTDGPHGTKVRCYLKGEEQFAACSAAD